MLILPTDLEFKNEFLIQVLSPHFYQLSEYELLIDQMTGSQYSYQ